MAPVGRRRVLLYIAIGLATGFVAGMFGVGGGAIIVPLLVVFAGFEQKRASGTSLAAIVPTAIVGAISYGLRGDIDLPAAVILIVGAVIGAQIGTWLLHRVPTAALRWAFIVFLFLVAIGMFVVFPSRGAEFVLTWGSGIGLGVAGLITGVFSGLLGVGGGTIIVPVLMFGFGTSDLVARGTSLLVIIPTSVSGTVGNLRRHNVDLRAAIIIGIAACFTTALGTWVATLVSPLVGNILFALFVIASATRMAMTARQAKSPRRSAAA